VYVTLAMGMVAALLATVGASLWLARFECGSPRTMSAGFAVGRFEGCFPLTAIMAILGGGLFAASWVVCLMAGDPQLQCPTAPPRCQRPQEYFGAASGMRRVWALRLVSGSIVLWVGMIKIGQLMDHLFRGISPMVPFLVIPLIIMLKCAFLLSRPCVLCATQVRCDCSLDYLSELASKQMFMDMLVGAMFLVLFLWYSFSSLGLWATYPRLGNAIISAGFAGALPLGFAALSVRGDCTSRGTSQLRASSSTPPQRAIFLSVRLPGMMWTHPSVFYSISPS
jgi:hypothetical protein